MLIGGLGSDISLKHIAYVIIAIVLLGNASGYGASDMGLHSVELIEKYNASNIKMFALGIIEGRGFANYGYDFVRNVTINLSTKTLLKQADIGDVKLPDKDRVKNVLDLLWKDANYVVIHFPDTFECIDLIVSTEADPIFAETIKKSDSKKGASFNYFHLRQGRGQAKSRCRFWK